MQLISIETTNFKRLRQFKASFREGLNVIVGDNAAGKSTLLQALECALYGAVVVPGKKDMIPTWGQSTWKIVMLFSVDGDEYRLTRSKTTAKLERVSDGDELVANGNTPVTAAIAELLDLDAKDYNLFMQSKQGETTGVLTFGAAALNRKVEEFAGISLIDRVQSLAQEEFRTKKAEADALSVPQEQIESAVDECVALNEALQAAEVNLKDVQQAFDELPELGAEPAPSVDPDAMQKRLDTITKLRIRVERAELERDNAQIRHQEALQRFEQLEKPEDAEALAARLNEVRREIKPAVSRVNELDRQMAHREDLVNRLEQAEQVLSEGPGEDEIRRGLDYETKQQSQRHDQRRDEQHRVVELNQQIKQLQSLSQDADCPTCGTRLTEHDPEKLAAEIAELIDQRDQHNRAWDELTRACQAIDKEVSKLERQLEVRQAKEAEGKNLRDTLADWPSAEKIEADQAAASEVHTGLLKEQAELDHRVEQLEGQQHRYHKAERQLSAERQSLDERVDEVEELSGQLAAGEAEGVPTEEDIRDARAALADYETQRNVLQARRQEAQHAVDLAKREFDQAYKDLERARQVLEDLRQRKDKAHHAAQDADAASRLSRFLRERRAGYLQEVWDAVLGAASKQVNMASKGMISRLVYDDGDFLYEEEGVLAPVTSASGAQKAHIGVAIRIGLARALYGSNALLIFDEPTESMSEHHASGLSASLAGAAAQCLLITHREQDQDLAANVIEVAA